ncbi:segregation/condensation protein A [Planctomycetales bacterium ZRK34]|nr:segregation/condensation protein A [Planctomycetales bacterium ZRK34]
MQDYRVNLDVYHGPLDLLLYLIKRDEIDIHDIPIAHITEQYLAHVRTLQALDINLAGEFLVMAATLMEIKSALMLPHEEGENQAAELAEGDDPTDPRYELVQQLLAYKRFKDAAAELDDRREYFSSRFPRHPARFEHDKPEGPPELDMEDVSVWDLLEAFSTMMEQVAGGFTHEVTDDDTPLELHAADIYDRLQRDGAMSLQQMFVGRKNKSTMIGLFCAMLELLRQRKVKAKQDTIAGEIYLEARPEEEWTENVVDPDEPPRTFDPSNADDFDWPDEQTRQRYVRRQERRAAGEVIIEDAEFNQDVEALEAEEQSTTETDQHD